MSKRELLHRALFACANGDTTQVIRNLAKWWNDHVIECVQCETFSFDIMQHRYVIDYREKGKLQMLHRVADQLEKAGVVEYEKGVQEEVFPNHTIDRLRLLVLK